MNKRYLDLDGNELTEEQIASGRWVEAFFPPTSEETYRAHIRTEDIADFAYPPLDERRYKQSGLDKLRAAEVATYKVLGYLDLYHDGTVKRS